jgi:hypothetical protein
MTEPLPGLPELLGGFNVVEFGRKVDQFHGPAWDAWPQDVQESLAIATARWLERTGEITAVATTHASVSYKGQWYCISRIYYDRHKSSVCRLPNAPARAADAGSSALPGATEVGASFAVPVLTITDGRVSGLSLEAPE